MDSGHGTDAPLMGTQIVQHPGDYRAVVVRVGIYDMLRHETDFANAGHDVGTPFSQRIGDTAIGLAFFAHELGLAVAH
ncbi:hypothetical protein [Rhodanobacter denitrificans]|uniref:hypothetical protein n=1 Tax=Rhodanobacter denitrificans TaxID=666685 RepID=UPI00022D93C4|nr:hypothetical protein [Rhodanobacter denitrificans]UJM86485.1 hypothetical protein LRJ86_17175 [Rhodanobacter denitrificans]